MVAQQRLSNLIADDSVGSAQGRRMKSGRKRVVIFGINYAPELTGIAPYTTEVAEHFSRQGHSVEVVTGIPHYPEWKRRPLPVSSGSNPTIRRYQHFIPRRPNAFGRLLHELSW